jgi:membrane protein YqaA with SNARE-associated domain
VHSHLWHLALFFAHLGGIGLLLLGILDSSFLFLPLGNDLLVISLAAHHHERMPYYAAMACAGSVIGCFLTDLACRRGGEKGLEKNFSGRTIQYVKRKVQNNATPALAAACILPPPFPFTPFIIVLAALQYPRWKMLGVVAAGRFVRFSVEGALAIRYERRILDLANNAALQWSIIGVMILSIAGSAASLYTWVKRARKSRYIHAG